MVVDRFSLAVAAAVGGEKAVRAELREHDAGELGEELVARAIADASAASSAARSGGGGAVRLVAALAAATRVTRSATTSRGGLGRPTPDPTTTQTIVGLRAAGASLPVIAAKVDRPYSTVRTTIARYEARTGTVITPARSIGQDGVARPARHTPPPGNVST